MATGGPLPAFTQKPMPLYSGVKFGGQLVRLSAECQPGHARGDSSERRYQAIFRPVNIEYNERANEGIS